MDELDAGFSSLRMVWSLASTNHSVPPHLLFPAGKQEKEKERKKERGPCMRVYRSVGICACIYQGLNVTG